MKKRGDLKEVIYNKAAGDAAQNKYNEKLPHSHNKVRKCGNKCHIKRDTPTPS